MGIGCLICDELLETQAPAPPVLPPDPLDGTTKSGKKPRTNKKATPLTPTLSDTVVTPCGHMFHEICLFQWFKNKNSTTCPCCRKLCTKAKLVRLYPSLIEEVKGATATSSDNNVSLPPSISPVVSNGKPIIPPKPAASKSCSPDVSFPFAAATDKNESSQSQYKPQSTSIYKYNNSRSKTSSTTNPGTVPIPGMEHSDLIPKDLDFGWRPTYHQDSIQSQYGVGNLAHLFPSPCGPSHPNLTSTYMQMHQPTATYPLYQSSAITDYSRFPIPITNPSVVLPSLQLKNMEYTNKTTAGSSYISTFFPVAGSSGTVTSQSNSTVPLHAYMSYSGNSQVIPSAASNTSGASSSTSMLPLPQTSRPSLPSYQPLSVTDCSKLYMASLASIVSKSTALTNTSNINFESGQNLKILKPASFSIPTSASTSTSSTTTTSMKPSNTRLQSAPLIDIRGDDSSSRDSNGPDALNKYEELNVLHQTLVADYNELRQKYGDLRDENELLKVQLESCDDEIKKLRKSNTASSIMQERISGLKYNAPKVPSASFITGISENKRLFGNQLLLDSTSVSDTSGIPLKRSHSSQLNLDKPAATTTSIAINPLAFQDLLRHGMFKKNDDAASIKIKTESKDGQGQPCPSSSSRVISDNNLI